MKIRTIATACLAGLVLAGCSSGASSSPTTVPTRKSAPTTTAPPATTTTISVAQAGAAYLAIAAPADAALATFDTQAGEWTDSTTNSEAEADAQPAIAALHTLVSALTNGQWPAVATADIHTMIGDVAALIGDLQGLSSVNLTNASGFTATVQRDAATLGSAVDLVRHDLGLPPATPAGG
jgi:hypothetical protein